MNGKRDCQCKRVKHEHGTARAYDSDACRCLRCCIANSRRKAAWRAGSEERFTTPHVIGTRRRLQALTTLGWSPREMGERTGLHEQVILRLRNTGRIRHVLWSTHEKVGQLYDELWNVPSGGPHARRMVNLARGNGWAPPMAWDDHTIDNPNALPDLGEREPARGVKDWRAEHVDEIAVERIIAGRMVLPAKTQSPERAEAVRRLAARGMSDAQIGKRVGMTTDAVLKLRQRNDIPAGAEPSRKGQAA